MVFSFGSEYTKSDHNFEAHHATRTHCPMAIFMLLHRTPPGSTPPRTVVLTYVRSMWYTTAHSEYCLYQAGTDVYYYVCMGN